MAQERCTETRQPAFVIESSQAESMVRSNGLASAEDLLPLLVPEAQRLARCPVSCFHVGAVGLGATGRIFVGVNIEFPGIPLHHSIHAEQFLVANAALHGEPSIAAIAVSSVPCGHCRQFLQELRSASDIRILVTSDGAAEFRPLSYYLPQPFGPADLLAADAPFLLEPHNNPIRGFVDDDFGGLPNGIGGSDEERLYVAAMAAARGAHAPYTRCAAGLAVGDGHGGVWAGGCAESAAYNPSLGPAQAALVAYVAGGGGEWGEIKEAALVEPTDATVSHESTTAMILAAVAPRARLRVYRYLPPPPTGAGDA